MATKSRSEPSSAPDSASDAIDALQNSGFGNMLGMGTAWAEAFSDMSAEFLSFLADRVKEDVKTQHKVLHCKDVHELHHIQAEFVQTAIDQYQDETGKLLEMSSTVFSDVLKGSKSS